jgi:predicted Fe-Mo cluster-binding NifX family protein
MPKGLAKPAQRALAGAGLRDLRELSKRTEAEVMALHGMGPRAMETLKAAMKERGVAFARAR